MARDGVFDLKPLHFIGLMSHKPFTEDYVPILPWLGVMWWGMALGQLALSKGWLQWSPPRWSQKAVRPLAFIGRWSLSWYMLHQPILLGGLTLVAAVLR
jgi:uncharacterized membrane protein